jgi:hypothetical protein
MVAVGCRRDQQQADVDAGPQHAALPVLVTGAASAAAIAATPASGPQQVAVDASLSGAW